MLPVAFHVALAALAPTIAEVQDAQEFETVRHGAPLFDVSARGPLRTSDRYIVDKYNEHVKLACVNWFGVYLEWGVVGGLETRTIAFLAKRIRDLGFNCIRLPFSTQSILDNPKVDHAHLAFEPHLINRTVLEVLDFTVDALENASLMVILNNHNSQTGWCCSGDSEEGVWYTSKWTAEQWRESLTVLARRYRNKPYVIGLDLRNEPHDYGSIDLTWGDGNEDTDLMLAQQVAGNQVLAVNPDLLIFVEGLCFSSDFRPVRDHPIKLNVANRVVYAPHTYEFFNSWNALSRLTSWKKVAFAAESFLAMSIMGALALLVTWYRIGCPMPLNGLGTPFLVGSIALWVSLSALILAIPAAVIFNFRSGFGACSYAAYHDVLPPMLFQFFVAAAGLAIAAGAFYVYTKRAGPVREQALPEVELASRSSTCDRQEEEPFRPRFEALRQWGRMHNFGVQGLCLCVTVACFSIWLHSKARYYVSPKSLTDELDTKWGYILEHRKPWTAPIWIGEFGTGARSTFWVKLIDYIANRNIDWAYWVLNPQKPERRSFMDGKWVNYPPGEETWSVFQADWESVKHVWLVDDLRVISEQPAAWPGLRQPCSRDVVGSECIEGD
mmetsp:Transcript_79274/g.220394  ORF Transcript_79274/g.220394 Transcript_79274/m.220394 type:complete len:610 (-) Transcript_79274:80-1909(-)